MAKDKKLFFDMDEILFQYSQQNVGIKLDENFQMTDAQKEELLKLAKEIDVQPIFNPERKHRKVSLEDIELFDDSTSNYQSVSEVHAPSNPKITLEEKKLNFGRKAQSLAARTHIPWDVAKEFIQGTETKAELKQIVNDIDMMTQMIYSNYDKGLEHELQNCGEKRQTKATIEIVGDKMFEKYGEAIIDLINAKVEGFNNSFVRSLEEVTDKKGLQELVSNVLNITLLSEENAKKVFDMCVEFNDKETYKQIFKDMTGSYINNSALNYIFKENVRDLSPSQVLEFGKTVSAINNSNYSNEEKKELKDMACDLLREPQKYEINHETKTKTPIGFDTRKEDLLRRAIDKGMDFERIEEMVERFDNVRGKDAFKIFKEESNKKHNIEF